VQVVYNIFDQNPKTNSFPRAAKKTSPSSPEFLSMKARSPEHSSAIRNGPKAIGATSTFCRETSRNSFPRRGLKPLLRDGITLPELALRFILSHSDVATTIPACAKSATSKPHRRQRQSRPCSRFSRRIAQAPLGCASRTRQENKWKELISASCQNVNPRLRSRRPDPIKSSCRWFLTDP